MANQHNTRNVATTHGDNVTQIYTPNADGVYTNTGAVSNTTPRNYNTRAINNDAPTIVSFEHKADLPGASWWTRMGARIERSTPITWLGKFMNDPRTIMFGACFAIWGSCLVGYKAISILLPRRFNSLFDLIRASIYWVFGFILFLTMWVGIVLLPYAALWWACGWASTFGYRAGRYVRAGGIKRLTRKIKSVFTKKRSTK